MILELKDICKDYIQGKMVIPVLKHVDFHMEKGEYVAIMGPSGSGKTTLMNIVGCLDQATSGQVILDGQDISKCTDNEMSDLSWSGGTSGFSAQSVIGRSEAESGDCPGYGE